MNYSFSRGRARIGVLVPFTNVNMESDLGLLRPKGVSLHYSRMGGYDADEIPDAKQMAGLGVASLEAPITLLSGARPDVILYGCTSATLTHGTAFDRHLTQEIERASGAQTVTAAGALAYSLEALGVSSIAFGSPYTPDINKAATAFLTDCGFSVVSEASVDEKLGNYGQADLTPDDVLKLGLRANSDSCEAIVLSCTEMRSVEIIGRLEAETGKPVVTSNQAMMFQACQMLGIQNICKDFGRLFSVGTN